MYAKHENKYQTSENKNDPQNIQESLLQETGEIFKPHLYNNRVLALIHTCTHKNKKNKTKISTFASTSVRKGV